MWQKINEKFFKTTYPVGWVDSKKHTSSTAVHWKFVCFEWSCSSETLWGCNSWSGHGANSSTCMFVSLNLPTKFRFLFLFFWDRFLTSETESINLRTFLGISWWSSFAGLWSLCFVRLKHHEKNDTEENIKSFKWHFLKKNEEENIN